MRSKLLVVLLSLPVLCLLAVGLYFLPPVHARLAWRFEEAWVRLGYTLRPPEEVVFIPQAATPTVSTTGGPTATSTRLPPTPALPTATPPPSATPLPTPTPLPGRVVIEGVRYEDQHGRWNYCAPATLSMALTFWGWPGNRDVVGPQIKPATKDKNVMPYEMEYFAKQGAGLGAVTRAGGDLDLLRRSIAAGFPVLVEKGVYFRDYTGVVGWMGHYSLVTGYDDAAQIFITQDSFISADLVVSYADLVAAWRSFNYTYMIIYPPEREAEVLAVLGVAADTNASYQVAAQRASDEIFSMQGIEQYFAWFNRGTSLVNLDDFGGAAEAYDQAFALYRELPEKERPWRMLWYQTGPYFAYFYTGRFYDVIELASTTLNAMQGDKNLEESYYWRGMALAALGDTGGAAEDYYASLAYHPGFEPAISGLQQLGLEP